jgi:hypothetical protein
MKKCNFFIILSALLISSCSSAPKAIEYTWTKKGANGQEKDYIIADSKCTAESYKSVPEIPSSDCSDYGGGFARGACLAKIDLKVKKMEAVRSKIYDGCMLNEGWEKQLLKQ